MTENYDVLLNPVFKLPIIYSEGTCEKVIDKRLEEYMEFLEIGKIGGPILHDGIRTFKLKISEMFEEYYLGHQNKAYNLFKEAFEYETEGNLPIKAVLPKQPLYRARVNTGDKDYEKSEMFHIKYDLRSKVQTQRFSFPGLPCLYLGATSYVCWLELNRPQMDQFQVAEIKQKDEKKDYKVIDMCIHPHAFYRELKEDNINAVDQDNKFLDYLRWWPIMAVCTVAVKNENDPFKPEYIIPQFVLQYILEENKDDCIGIKYMSIKAGRISEMHYETDSRIYTNYVIPVKSSDKTADGFCRFLSEQFEVTNTVSGKEHQMVSNMVGDKGIKIVEMGKENKEENSLDKASIFTKAGVELPYSKSSFRMIEKTLSNEILEDLKRDVHIIYE